MITVRINGGEPIHMSIYDCQRIIDDHKKDCITVEIRPISTPGNVKTLPDGRDKTYLETKKHKNTKPGNEIYRFCSPKESHMTEKEATIIRENLKQGRAIRLL